MAFKPNLIFDYLYTTPLLRTVVYIQSKDQALLLTWYIHILLSGPHRLQRPGPSSPYPKTDLGPTASFVYAGTLTLYGSLHAAFFVVCAALQLSLQAHHNLQHSYSFDEFAPAACRAPLTSFISRRTKLPCFINRRRNSTKVGAQILLHTSIFRTSNGLGHAPNS